MKALSPIASGVSMSIFSIVVLGLFFALPVFGQATVVDSDELWSPVNRSEISERGRRVLRPEEFITAKLNTDALRARLDSAPLEFSGAARMMTVDLSIPMPDGTLTRFRLEKSPVLSPEIGAKFPEWSTYHGYGIDDPTMTARFSWTDDGFRGSSVAQRERLLVDPYQTGDTETYQGVLQGTASGRPFEISLRGRRKLSGRFDENDPLQDQINHATDFAHGRRSGPIRLAVATTSSTPIFSVSP